MVWSWVSVIELKFNEFCLLRSVYFTQLRVMRMNWWGQFSGLEPLICSNAGFANFLGWQMLIYLLKALLFFPRSFIGFICFYDLVIWKFWWFDPCVWPILLPDRLPYSIRILLESAIRNCDDFQVTGKDVEKILDWENSAPKQVEIPFKPARVLLQVPNYLNKFPVVFVTFVQILWVE